jgi:hypothetical protein
MRRVRIALNHGIHINPKTYSWYGTLTGVNAAHRTGCGGHTASLRTLWTR